MENISCKKKNTPGTGHEFARNKVSSSWEGLTIVYRAAPTGIP